MDIRYPILRHVAELSGSAVDNALLAALDTSDTIDQEQLVEVLLGRANSRAFGGLIAHFHALTPTAQQQVLARMDNLSTALRPAIKSPQRRTRLNAIRLLAATHRPRLAYLAVLGLSDGDADVADQAANCLAEYARWYQDTTPPPKPEDDTDTAARKAYAAWCEDRDALLGAFRSVLDNFESHNRESLLTALLPLCDELGETLAPALSNPTSALGRALADRVVQETEPSAAGLLYLALGSPDARVRAAGRIASLIARPLAVELIRRVWRCDDEAVARGLGLIRRVAFFDRPGWWEQVPDDLAEQVVRFIDCLGTPDHQKLDWISALITDGSDAQRSAALERLAGDTSAESTELLRRLSDHPLADVADAAAEALLARNVPGVERVMARQLARPDTKMRERATEAVGSAAFEKLWDQFDRMQTEPRQFAARQLRRMLDDLPQRLAGRLIDPQPDQRLRAVQVIDLCEQQDKLIEALLARNEDPNAKVRSAVVKLLGKSSDPRAEQAVTDALADPDRRVRANAIEALEMMQAGDCSPQLRQMLADTDNRIRANAIKALMAMDLASARQSLHTMLGDASAEHRVSALWVVERMGWMKTAEIVLNLARRDPDRRVRRRALQTLGELRRIYRGIRGRGEVAAAG